MASFTYSDFHVVLKRAGFEHLRSEKHETWRKFLPNGSILRVRISHQHKRDIPKWLFHEMLRQAGLTLDEFRTLLNSWQQEAGPTSLPPARSSFG